MGAVPKRKVSRHRRGNRRQHLALTAPHMVTCPRCSSLMRNHYPCKECGTYRGRQILEAAETETER